MCRCDDKAPPFILLLLEEEEATKLELLFTEAETGARKTTEDIIISFHRRRAFSLSLSLSLCSRARRRSKAPSGKRKVLIAFGTWRREHKKIQKP
jgi:hypothetical protein